MKCIICTLDKSLEEMHPDLRKKKRGDETICESCFIASQKHRRKLDKRRYRKDPNKNITEKYKVWALKRNYNLTPEQFNQIFLEQDSKCAACGSKTSRWTKGWCVDHDHSCCEKLPTCGKCVRGVLCMPCNMAAGVMKDNIQDLQSLVKYLENKRACIQ